MGEEKISTSDTLEQAVKARELAKFAYIMSRVLGIFAVGELFLDPRMAVFSIGGIFIAQYIADYYKEKSRHLD